MDKEQNEMIPADNEVTTTGQKTVIDEPVAGVLCYLFGFISGIVFLVVEKNSRFIRFHAMQSIVITVPFFIFGLLYTVLLMIPVINIFLGIIGFFLIPLLAIFVMVICLVAMIKAYNKEMYKIPVAGNLAENLLEKVKI